MDLEWLEDFQSLAETGNFSRTAEVRNLTQSALSRRIQALEVWAGAKLVDRSSYPATLTEAGVVVLDAAREIVPRMRAVRLRTSIAESRVDEPIVIAVSNAVAPEHIPGWLSSVETRLSRLATRFEYHAVERCFTALEKGATHFVVCPGSEAPTEKGEARFASQLFALDEMAPVSAADCLGQPLFELPGTRRKPIPYLSVTPDAALGGAVRRMLTEHTPPASVRVCFESPQKSVVQRMALAGKGVAWLPRSTVAADLATGALVLAGAEDWVVPFEIRIYRGAGTLPGMAESLWRLLEEMPAGR